VFYRSLSDPIPVHPQRLAAGISLPPLFDNETDTLVIGANILQCFIILESAAAFNRNVVTYNCAVQVCAGVEFDIRIRRIQHAKDAALISPSV